MKTKISIIAALLFLAPFLHAGTELRPVLIRLTQMASDGKNEIVAPAVIVSDTQEARIRIGSDAALLDVSVCPKLNGDQVALTMRSFKKDQNGKESVTSLPVVVMRLDSPVEIRVGASAYRVIATLDIPKPKKGE